MGREGRGRSCVRVLLVGLVVVVLAGLSGCGQQRGSSTGGLPGSQQDPVVLGMPADPRTLDPQLTGQNIDWNVCLHIFDTFIGRDADGKPVPALAESWEPVDLANNVWRFHLRKGVKFHNGEPWNAEVAKWNFERARTEPESQMKRFAAEAKQVTIVDEYTLDIALTEPISLALNQFVQFQMVPKQYIEQVGKEQFGLKPVGTGPYKLVEWVKDDHITLEANEEYWGGAPQIKHAIIKPVPEPATRVAGLISGDLDVIRGVSVFDVEKIEQSGVAKVISRPGPRMWHIKLDTFREKDSPGLPPGKNPFTDVRVRKAMYHAINAEELIQKVMKGYAIPASQLVAPFIWGHNPDVKRLPYDPDRARELLAEAGWPNGFTVRFDVPQGWDLVGEAIANYLGNVGIKVELNVLPNSVLLQKEENYEVSMVWGGWGSTMINTAAEGLVHSVDPKKGYGRANYGRYGNPELDRLIEEARVISDPGEQLKAYQEIARVLMEDVGIIPVLHETILAGARKGFEVTPRVYEHVYVHDIRLTEPGK